VIDREPPTELQAFLRPTPTIESAEPEVVAYAQKSAAGAGQAIEQAVRLYYAVRDDIRYDPYGATGEGLRATATLASGRGWCVAKAVLLAACCRALGIPARLGFADVRNHLSTARMREIMKTDVFYWHGYTSIFLEGRWVKATPAFNIALCEKFRLLPLEFDGRTDSLYHPFDAEGRRHMEYVHDRGEFADVPIDRILATFREHYADALSLRAANFDRDVEEETRTD
jgi:transglutaminase-like putative cysteine protease